MSGAPPAPQSPIPLTPVLVSVDSQEFQAITGWPFPDPFVLRLLRDDIPQRVQFGNCRIWIYRDPTGEFVGFGTLEFAETVQNLRGRKTTRTFRSWR